MSADFSQFVLGFVTDLLGLYHSDTVRRDNASYADRMGSLYLFMSNLEQAHAADGMQMSNRLTLSFERAELVADTAEVDPPIDSARLRGDLASAGVRLSEDQFVDEHGVVGMAGSIEGGQVRARAVPALGWIFLVTSSEEESGQRLTDRLDSALDHVLKS